MFWHWEHDRQFDLHIVQAARENVPLRWVDSVGNPVHVGGAMAANERLDPLLERVQRGESIGNIRDLVFRDPASFRAGELHHHLPHWEKIAETNCSATQTDVLGWIKNKVSVFEYFRHFTGSFKGHNHDSDRPPQKAFQNNPSCKSFVGFIQKTLLDRLRTGAVSLVGRVGVVDAPHIVLPLTVEPTKPRLCHDARYLNLWMQDKPFKLDKLGDLPRYVSKKLLSDGVR